MVQKEQERGKGSTTGSFERAKPSRLNRSQSSRTWLVGSRQGWIPIDNGGGIVESRPGTHCAHPLTMPDYYPPLVCFVGSRSNGILLRSLELSDDPCSVSRWARLCGPEQIVSKTRTSETIKRNLFFMRPCR